MDNPIAKAVDDSKFQTPVKHVKIVSDGTTTNTRVFYGDSDEPLRGVMSIEFSKISHDDPIPTVKLEFCPVSIAMLGLPEKERLAQQLRILLGTEYLVVRENPLLPDNNFEEDE